jgi:starch synthase
MKILFAASEALPHAKTGGLADVIGALPGFLRNMGLEVSVVMPRYRGMTGSKKDTLTVTADEPFTVDIYEQDDFLFVDHAPFFDRKGLYGTQQGDYEDNCERYTLFCKVVAALGDKYGFDILHCHDWQSGIVPLYVKAHATSLKTVFTIHNLGYQGRFPAAKFPLLDVDRRHFTPDGIEYYGDINFLKAGIVYADRVTTVSENYAREIQSPELGFGLDGVLRSRQRDLGGIINGIDYSLWNPQTDTLIPHPYTDFAGKQQNKTCFTQECDLTCDRPVIGMVSRIADQKGFDLIIKIFEDIMELGYNFILLGVGDEAYHRKLKQYEQVYPTRVSINLKFDERLAHRIYAGSDFFLMPSQYEPCGLGQLISLKYGSVPIVRRTGGLADTVTEFDPVEQTGNGFVFSEYSPEALLDALSRAYQTFGDRDIFISLSERCMTYDFSWNESAKKYLHLYETM